MEVSAYKLVMFDLDGTLVDSVSDLHEALNRALDDVHEAKVDIESTRQWVGNGAAVLVNRALQAKLDVQDDHPKLNQTLDRFYEHYSSVNGSASTCYQGAQALLEKLRKAGCKTAVVTNKPYKPACALLEALGLNVDAVIGGDSTPERKPSPLPLRECMRVFDVKPEEVVMVGDSKNDFIAAERAGVFCVGVSYGYNHGVPVQPEQVGVLIDSLSELR